MGQGLLTLDGVRLRDIAAAVGTPAYVYDGSRMRSSYRTLSEALSPVSHRIHFAVKANGNLAVLALFRSLGAGADIVSGGELERARRAGFSGEDIVFGGVGKTREEMSAALAFGVGLVNVESEEELDVLAGVARGLGVTAPVAIRVNPEVLVDVHPYTATGERGKKFGVPMDDSEAVALKASRTEGVRLRGLAMHIGSGIATVAPFTEAVERLVELAGALVSRGVTTLEVLDLGGGLGIRYHEDDHPPGASVYAEAILPHVRRSGLRLVVEPGRFLVGEAGVLLATVLYRKKAGGRHIAVTDAGMTDLLRPSHYQAYHAIEVDGADGRALLTQDVVGPVCESGDFLAFGRELPEMASGDLLAIRGAGAYGFTMSSTYNARTRPPEVLVENGRFAVIREREPVGDLMRGETTRPVWVEPAPSPGAAAG